jgi:hypothetical protein
MSESDTSDEEYNEYQRKEEERERLREEKDREMKRRVKPWERRIQRWLTDKGKHNTADEILAISEFFGPIHNNYIGYGCDDSLREDGHLLPVAEMKKLCEWWHTDPAKRKVLNKMLRVYSTSQYMRPPGSDPWDGEEGPELQIARGWTRLSDEQREFLKTTKVTPDDAWDGIHYIEDEDVCADCPVKKPTWAFIDEYMALVAAHNALPST